MNNNSKVGLVSVCLFCCLYFSTIGKKLHNKYFNIVFFIFTQAYFRRAMALSSLSRTEEALIAHCVSICLNKSAQNVSSAARHDVTRVG